MANKVEQTIHDLFISHSELRHVISDCYQRIVYMTSPKLKFEGNIHRITPQDGKEYFFGYYDKSPWDAQERFMLCLRVDNAKTTASDKEAEIVLIDTQKGNSCEIITVTRTWNSQQGSMLQWLGPKFDSKILYNDFRDGQYISIILNINTRQETVLPVPVYTVSNDGSFALTLDFSRLHRLRPGYGYVNLPDKTKGMLCPNEPCIWKVELNEKSVIPILKYTDFATFEPKPSMAGAEHKVNHLMLSPSGSRFMVLHRWFQKGMKYSRLVTCNTDGTEMFNLSDDDFVSHCTWKNEDYILSFLNRKESGQAYYLLRDKTKEAKMFWQSLQNTDGHPSYSPDGSMIVTDTYPDRRRVCSLYCNTEDTIQRIARVFSPFAYKGDYRCDLHPRWNRTGNKICFDACFEGKRGLYTIKREDRVNEAK